VAPEVSPPAEVDEVTAVPPSSPSYREGASIWVWDDAGRVHFPRIGVEAVGASWTTTFETAVCLAAPNGALLLATASDPPLAPTDAAGRPRVLGAGPLRFECVEPFARWRIDFDGQLVSTDVFEHVLGREPKVRIGQGRVERAVRFTFDAEMRAPAWFQGTHDPSGHHVPGEHRFEQLCSVTGSVEIDGTAAPFAGGGLRVHRKGGDRNDYGEFHGHVWQSARFPSGRAFGYIHYRSGPDGAPRYQEGWLDDGGGVAPTRCRSTPWLTGVRASGEDVSFALLGPSGVVEIEGVTDASSFRPPRQTSTGAEFPLLHSGIARYRWDGEEAYGMVERSARLESPFGIDVPSRTR
jgi:hypothetical protein